MQAYVEIWLLGAMVVLLPLAAGAVAAWQSGVSRKTWFRVVGVALWLLYMGFTILLPSFWRATAPLYFLLFGLVLIVFRNHFAQAVAEGQNQLGFHYGRRELFWTKVLGLVVGSGFTAFGLASLAGWISLP